MSTICTGGAPASEDFSNQEYPQERTAHAETSGYQSDGNLSEKEIRLDKKLAGWKAAYLASCGGDVPCNMPVQKDENIWNSKLYAFCKALPKGADLHVHGMALLPFDELLAFVKSRDELYIGTGEDNRCFLACREDPAAADEDELHVQDALAQGLIDPEELRTQWTLPGGDDGKDNVWEWFETLFHKHQALSATPALIEAYYRHAFRYYCENKVLHLEVRELFFGSGEEALANAKAIRDAYYAVKNEYPDFIASVVGTGLKYTHLDRALTDRLLDNALLIRRNLKDDFDPDDVHEFLVGIDLVNEEGRSRPLTEFAGRLSKIVAGNPGLHLVLHAGESINASSDNVIAAYQLGPVRIGHGLNLCRFPKILDLVCEAGICLEVCPVSNQVLGYVSDLRNHPAAGYLKRGVLMCMCSDDPAYQEHTALTDDFFAAIVCWDLTLTEIRQLCINSIACSCADDIQKGKMMQRWEKEWEAFLSFGE